ncbi:MAG TPA: TIGR03560 family F420-dependent LLM class oxidoreductase [Chloroflexota bacterium]|nr:TIGR03560 family F420-dependent LLM class oxidoreductase [Chloroflexota bacterium]
MKLGIMIESQEGVGWNEWKNIVQWTEDLGFESLWRSDHLLALSGATDSEVLSFWPSLTVVATRSRRIRFGQLVSPVSFRDPMNLARNAVGLDLLSEGRFVLGVGAGWNEREHVAFGIPFPPVGQRMDMLDEAIQVIKLLWTGDPVSFAGKHFRLQDAQARPTPSRPSGVPLIVAGKGEQRLLRMVAKYADEWNYTGPMGETYQGKADVLAKHCAAVQREPASIMRSWMGGYMIARDAADLRRRSEKALARDARLQGVSVEDVPAQLRERGMLVGTPDDVITEIKAREAMGIERFMLQTLDLEDLGVLDTIAQEILPRV